ncbi:hypothetical protein Adt_30873 [Abeliophyllum distichum]|uniref:Uncharacterized protein n=1 Tax=Abeliophyllum distichum TaxID=126358 RepID=A0ABD1RCG6_9LAMI
MPKLDNNKIGVVHDEIACLSFDGGSSQSLMARHGMLARKTLLLVDGASLIDARSNFLLGEFNNLRIRLKDIDDGDTVGTSKNMSSSREETQVGMAMERVRDGSTLPRSATREFEGRVGIYQPTTSRNFFLFF